jgi:outer membrane receptor protein involved in Fe transport
MMPIELKDLKADYQTVGKLKNDYIQLLPKVAVKYNFNSKNNFYASISKGHRSGGYNVQMFSDIVQNGLQNSIKTTIKNGVGEKLNGFAQMGMPSSVIGMINGMMEQYLTTSEINIAESTTYKPEYSWNYEVGSHLQLFNGKLQADFAAFYMDTRNQQIAKFAETGLGRITINAGESESYGVEANLVASLNKNLQLNASYGYTKATFVKYDAGKEEDYSGNYVPFVPRHTMNIGGSYAFLFNNSWAQSLTLGANVTGAGKIYWTEANNASQDFYTSLNGYISLKTQAIQIDLWGRNLTNNDYTTFYFETMGRGYEQRCKPLQIGVDVRLHF